MESEVKVFALHSVKRLEGYLVLWNVWNGNVQADSEWEGCTKREIASSGHSNSRLVSRRALLGCLLSEPWRKFGDPISEQILMVWVEAMLSKCGLHRYVRTVMEYCRYDAGACKNHGPGNALMAAWRIKVVYKNTRRVPRVRTGIQA